MGRGFASTIDRNVKVPPGWRYVQWLVENAEEMVEFLEPYDVRLRGIPGHGVLVQGRLTGMNLQLMPGDCLVIRPATNGNSEQLGVIYSANAKEYRESETLHLEQNPKLH